MKIIVIHASDRDTANAFCNSIGAEGDTFSVPLFDDLEQIAGYWTGWNVDDEQLSAITNYFTWVFDTKDEALSACGWHVAQNPVEVTE